MRTFGSRDRDTNRSICIAMIDGLQSVTAAIHTGTLDATGAAGLYDT